MFLWRREARERIGQLIVCRVVIYCLSTAYQFERRYLIPPSIHNDDRDPQDVAKHVAVNLRRHWNKKNDDNDRVVDELKVGKMRMKYDINSNVSI